MVSAGDRAAGRATVSDGRETHYVACFLAVAGSRIVELVEVWTDVVATPPVSTCPTPGRAAGWPRC